MRNLLPYRRVDEAHLTGESDEVEKTADSAPCMYAGSSVLQGYGRVLVTAVGPNTQQGAIQTRVLQSRSAAPQAPTASEAAA